MLLSTHANRRLEAYLANFRFLSLLVGENVVAAHGQRGSPMHRAAVGEEKGKTPGQPVNTKSLGKQHTPGCAGAGADSPFVRRFHENELDKVVRIALGQLNGVVEIVLRADFHLVALKGWSRTGEWEKSWCANTGPAMFPRDLTALAFLRLRQNKSSPGAARRACARGPRAWRR